jgi:uncharacterized membrane protein YGL010W
MAVTVLTATAFSYKPGYATQAALLHAFSWIAQFIGHGVAEGRAPALLDNLIGGRTSVFTLLLTWLTLLFFLSIAVVLAPFFVHLEILFGLGYRPAMHKRIINEIGKEITKLRKAEGDKKRKAQ